MQEIIMMEGMIRLLMPGLINLDVDDLAHFFEKSKQPKAIYLYEFPELEESAIVLENIVLMDNVERLLIGFSGEWSLLEINTVMENLIEAKDGTVHISVSFYHVMEPRKMIVFVN